MPKNSVTRFINNHFFEQDYRAVWTSEGYARLRTYLGNVTKGQPRVYDTPFAKGTSTNQLLKSWLSELASIRDRWPSLWEFEIDLARKVGPLSVEKPLSERFVDIAHYYNDILLPSRDILPSAMDAVLDEWSGLKGLRLRNPGLTVTKMKKSTNSGSPYFAKRRDVYLDTTPCTSVGYQGRHPDVHTWLNEDTSQEAEWAAAAVLGWRGQEGGPSKEDVKQRVVWMFPFSVNINELQVYQPLIEGSQKLNLVPAWVSMDAVDKEITALFDTKAADDLVICTDFSRFDQHFNQTLQDSARTILAGLLTRNASSVSWLNDVFPIKYLIPLCWEAKDGKCTYFEGYHGMASGSGGTNADETLAHRSLQYEAAMLHDRILNPHSQCLGDDGILSYPGITVDDVVSAYESHGQECNVDKQYASTQDCVYLRRWHHQDYRVAGVCVGVYSTCRALGRLRYLERFMDPEVWGVKMVALRQLSILENCKYHPLREQFVRFCMKRDKYRLGVDIPGFFDNITKLAKESIDYMPDFLGYTKTLQGEGPEGIANWWIVNYLKSIR